MYHLTSDVRREKLLWKLVINRQRGSDRRKNLTPPVHMGPRDSVTAQFVSKFAFYTTWNLSLLNWLTPQLT